MNKIKMISLASLTVIAIAMAGCKTESVVSTGPDGNNITNVVKTFDTVRAVVVCNEAATVGTTEILNTHPEWAPKFQLAAEQLATLAKSPSIGVQDILNIAHRLPVKELKSQTARLSFEGATLLISVLNVPDLPAEKLAALQPIAQAISDGIMVGIQNAPAPQPKPVVSPAN